MPRIVAGVAGGRRIVAPPGDRTRPTSDRAREGIFGTLATVAHLDGADVLDLYAGSGALGLEALSRGASSALLVEADRRTAGIARANADTLRLAGATVRVARVESMLSHPRPEGCGPFGIVLADPPYALADVDVGVVLRALSGGGWLHSDAVVALERSRRGPAPDWPPGLTAIRSRRYGEAMLWYGRAS